MRSTKPAEGRRWYRRLSALPRVLAGAPAYVVVAIGVVLVSLGILIALRPLTSLFLLGAYVGVSAIVSGVFDLTETDPAPRWWDRLSAGVWIVAGVIVLVWLGRSIELLPRILAVLLVIGGLASLGDALARGRRWSSRLLAVCWGGAQIVFGILSLAWPDVTLLVVAVVFGIRTVVFGASLLVRGGREWAASGREATAAPVRPRASRRRRVVTDAGRVLLACLAVTSATVAWGLNDWLSDGAPVIDAFYYPPAEVPAEHGRLIRWDDFQGELPEGGTVQRILYTTQDANGRPAVASGLVIRPEEPLPGVRPIVIWNHGTTGIAQGCAPSLNPRYATEWAIPAVDEALDRGWVVVASDYSGQGAPGVFPYLIGRGEARSSLDAVLAARELEGLNLSSDAVVWGHSQGGHAALWTTQIAGAYTPELNIVGTAALAPVTDPHELASEFTQGRASPLLTLLVSWVLVPYSETYWDVDLGDYVATSGRLLVREMTQRCPTEPGVLASVLTALGISVDRPLYVGDLTGGALGRRLDENAVTGAFGTPILMGWGADDEVIPTSFQDDFVAQQCENGEQVWWAEYPRYGHLRILEPGSRFLPLLIRWSEALIEGDTDDIILDRCGL